MKQLRFLITLVVIAAGFFYLQDKFNFLDISITPNNGENVENKKEEEKGEEEKEKKDYVEIFMEEGGSVKVNVDLAKTDQERALGLSNRKYLGTYDGMWFVFNEDSSSPFWMKDCLIPLDIIFVDASGFIVDIKDNNAPCTEDYCPSIYPSQPYRGVLEVNANWANDNGVEIGNSITTHFSSTN